MKSIFLFKKNYNMGRETENSSLILILTRQNRPYKIVPTLTWQQKQHLYALGSRTFITPNLFILTISCNGWKIKSPQGLFFVPLLVDNMAVCLLPVLILRRNKLMLKVQIYQQNVQFRRSQSIVDSQIDENIVVIKPQISFGKMNRNISLRMRE